jgi:nucleotide-binding universal stress UspA family protein
VLGSVSSDLTRRAPCPVMIVPGRAAVESRAA